MVNVRPVSAPPAPAVCLPSFCFFINHLPVFKNFIILPCISLSMLKAGTLAALLHTGPVDEGVLAIILLQAT